VPVFVPGIGAIVPYYTKRKYSAYV